MAHNLPSRVQNHVPQAPSDYSVQTAHEIDCEVRRIIDEQYAQVHTLLEEYLEVLQQTAARLLEQETMTGDKLRGIAAHMEVAALEAPSSLLQPPSPSRHNGQPLRRQSHLS